MSEHANQSRFRLPSGIGIRHAVTLVVCSVIFGALEYAGNFTPSIFGTVINIYPPGFIGPSFGIWFGIWGALSAALGTMLSSIVAGELALGSLLFYIAAFLGPAVPGIFYRKHGIESWGNLFRFIGWSMVGKVAANTLVAWNIGRIGWGGATADIVWTEVYPVLLTHSIVSVILASLVHKYVSPYMVKWGLVFKRFMG